MGVASEPVEKGAAAREDVLQLDVPIVVGAGPGGLATAYALQQAGISAYLLERAGQVCSSWRTHYDGLLLNSPRRLSSLPGRLMPRRFGTWVPRDEFIEYVERYAQELSPRIAFDTEVERIDRDDGGWRLATSRGPMWSRHVVVATGLNALPKTPSWPGIDRFEGELIHPIDYQRPEPYRGRKVLVVGMGATGAEISAHLLRGGVGQLWVSIRSSPIILRRRGWLAAVAQIYKHGPLPDVLFDLGTRIAHRLSWGDLTPYGIAPPEGLATSLKRRSHGLTLDRGLIPAVKKGWAEIVAAVERFDGADVVLADGRRLQPDVVIAAIGQRTNLGPLVGHLGVLSDDGRPVVHGGEDAPDAAGLFFVGYRIPPGQLPDLRPDSRAIARRVAGGRSGNGPRRALPLRSPAMSRPRYKPSKTADVNATQRACEMHHPPEKRLFTDPWARHFIQTPFYRLLASNGPLARFALKRFDRAYAGVHALIMLRYEHYWRELERALADGIDQVVLLGAGYDSTSLRHDLRGAKLFEVDSPHTQGAKLRSLEKHRLLPPADVVYVACDFEAQSPGDRLRDSGFDASRRSFVLWYGVLYYLSDTAVRQTFTDVARFTAPGSRLVFDYLDASVIDGTTTYPGAVRAMKAVTRRKEPYVFGLRPDSAAALAEESGFRVEENLRVPDLAECYGPPAGVWCSTDDWSGVLTTERKPTA